MKLDDKELDDPFNKHLGDSLTSETMGESLGNGLEFEASMVNCLLFHF